MGVRLLHVEAANEGRIINISSIVGKQGNFGQANYAAAKSGVSGFTRTLALELAASGFTRTDMLSNVPEDVREDLREEIPLKRFAAIEDIAELVRYLVSERSSYITGEDIVVTALCTDVCVFSWFVEASHGNLYLRT